MSEHATEIDVAGATAALEERLAPSREAIEVARDPSSGQFTSRPEESATPAAGEAEPEAEGQAKGTPDAAAAEEEISFTHIPDEALTPELLAVKKAMQADFTRKTQEIAEYRKLSEEFEIETPEELRRRLELQKTLSDPSNWPQLHTELTTYLQSQGLSRPVAEQAAAVSLGQAVGELSDDDAFVDDGEEEYGAVPSAVEQRLAAMEHQHRELMASIQRREIEAQQEARFTEIARNLTNQENQIRSKYAETWGEKADEYIEAVYDLAGDSGDLSVGLTRLETMLGYDAARYLAGKEAALRAPTPVPGEGVVASGESEGPHTLEEGHAMAMEYVRRQAAAEAGI